MLIVKAEALPGTTIQSACRDAVSIAKVLRARVELVFNGSVLMADYNSRAEVLAQQYAESSRQSSELPEGLRGKTYSIHR